MAKQFLVDFSNQIPPETQLRYRVCVPRSCLPTNIIGCTPGSTRHDIGIDWVTARYDSPTKRWWLCDGDYQPLVSRALTPYLIK